MNTCVRVGVAAVLLGSMGAGAAAPCLQPKIDEVARPVIGNEPASVLVDCDLTLERGQRIEKSLVLRGSSANGVTIDCDGATLDGAPGTPNAGKDMITIRSTIDKSVTPHRFTRPSNITIRHCNINGSMRIYGMGTNGEAPIDGVYYVRDSSRLDGGHVSRLRTAAPTLITLDDLTFTASGRTPLYISPGVTYVTVINSEFKGDATRTSIYLDAESAFNLIKNNYLHTKIFDEWDYTWVNRLGPQIAVDTSSYNRIYNNWFSGLEGGGIHTYRNCGEGGTVRHGSPSYNKIVNNVFYYDQSNGENPAVLLGARGEWWRDVPHYWNHCDDDEGYYAVGSAVSNNDYSRNNLVMQNQIYKLSVYQMLQTGDLSNSNNIFRYNETVTVAASRYAGCYTPTSYKDMLLHGESTDVAKGANGLPVCSTVNTTCTDGDLSYPLASGCSIQRVHFDCQVSGNNAGCTTTPRCGAGKRIVSVRAACNLEWGSVTATELSTVPGHTLKVVRQSDTRSQGSCWVEQTRISYGDADIVRTAFDKTSVNVGCKEYDANGGDCHISGILYCR